MKSGPLAVRLQNTLFRVDEITWLKIQRLTLWEKLSNLLLVASGVFFIYLMKEAKGSLWNPPALEALLGLLPIFLGLSTHGDTRMASSGDTQDSYFQRPLGFEINMKELTRPLQERQDSFAEFKPRNGAYHYLINTNRVAWVSSWFTLNAWPLWMGLLFLAYAWALPQGYHVPDIPRLPHLKLLEFPAGMLDKVVTACYLCAAAGALSLLASIKLGIVIGGVGGVADTLHMYGADRRRLFDLLSGVGSTAEAPSPIVAVDPARQPVVAESFPRD